MKNLDEAARNYAKNHSKAPDKETPDWIINDFKAGAEWYASQFKEAKPEPSESQFDKSLRLLDEYMATTSAEEKQALVDKVNKMWGEEVKELEPTADGLWASIINDARQYNGSPHDLELLTRHFKKHYAISLASTLPEKAEQTFTLQDLDAAFVAGRGKTSWEQFKKDHGIE